METFPPPFRFLSGFPPPILPGSHRLFPKPIFPPAWDFFRQRKTEEAILIFIVLAI